MQRGVLGQRDVGAAVGCARPAEPGELHAGLRLVRAEPRGDLRLPHVHHALGQPCIFGEPPGVEGLLRLRQCADRLLGREDALLGGLVLAALAGEEREEDEEGGQDLDQHVAAPLLDVAEGPHDQAKPEGRRVRGSAVW